MVERPDLANRAGFDQVAQRYDRVRPGYPDVVFDELFGRLPVRPAVVEVGPGTGQATRSLLARGARVTAVELGAAMADQLTANLAGPDLEVLVSSFEDAALADRSFDAVVAATAYHWVPTGAQITRPARLLRPGGWLAVIDTIQVDSLADHGFWDRIQDVFERHGEGRRAEDPPLADFDHATPALLPALAVAAEFTDVEVLRFPHDQTYTAAQYAELHRTYSGWLAMPPAAGEALVADICAVIDAEYGGQVVRPLAITLLLGRRSGTPDS
jgi:SAM-dependent methyltransferase